MSDVTLLAVGTALALTLAAAPVTGDPAPASAPAGAALSAAATPRPPAVPPGARSLTLAECVDLALTHSPDLAMAREEINASRASFKAMRGNLGPKLRLEGNVMRWDDAITADFSMPGLPIEIPPFEVQEKTTTSLTVSLAYPLGSIWSIYEGYKVKELGVDVAKVQREVARRTMVYDVTEAFYRTLQTMSLSAIAEQSVAQLEAQVERARSFFTHGVVGRNDLLRAELGLAAAKQRAIQAQGNQRLAQSRLAFTMGLPPDVVVVPQISPAAPESQGPANADPGPPSLAEAERRAVKGRVELAELDARLAQAGHGVHAAWSKMLPSVNLAATYQRNSGSTFMPEKSYFLGLFAEWNVWEWGATYYAIPEAKAHLRKALAGRRKLRDGIRLETRAAHVALTTAAKALEVAHQAVTQAEENYRLESSRYAAQASTSFDVLDAETQLTQARAQLQTARFQHLIARAALAKAMGEVSAATGSGATPTQLTTTRPTNTEKTDAAR